MEYRVEHDSMGEVRVPADKYWGAQTERSHNNFPIGVGIETMPAEIVHAFGILKKAAARANRALRPEKMTEEKLAAIEQAADEVISGQLLDNFPLVVWQTGSGTQSNMNSNEVIANRAIEILGGKKGDYSAVNPNDDVNCGQSTNDVIPTAGKMTSLRLLQNLKKELLRLHGALCKKAEEFDHVIKMGRTQMQDAVPIRLGQEFGAYRAVIERDLGRMTHITDELMYVNMGGTAIGTCINADESYVSTIVSNLSAVTGLDLRQAKNLIDSTQNLDCFVTASSTMKTCAVNLSKISNDLRMMSSGPRTGFHEINLPPKQNGSSIMPGMPPNSPPPFRTAAFSPLNRTLHLTARLIRSRLSARRAPPSARASARTRATPDSFPLSQPKLASIPTVTRDSSETTARRPLPKPACACA